MKGIKCTVLGIGPYACLWPGFVRGRAEEGSSLRVFPPPCWGSRIKEGQD